MASTAAAIKAQFDLQTRLFKNALDGVTDEESNTRISDKANNMKWIAGHALNARQNTFARVMGGTPDTSFEAQFARGASLDPNASYPPIEEIVSKWSQVSSGLSEKIDSFPEEALDAKSKFPSPIADDTFRGLLAFLVSHESYHIGQLSILRKMNGKDAMSYS